MSGAMDTLKRPLGILLGFVFAAILMMVPVTASADHTVAHRDDRQRIADYREDARVARAKSNWLIGAAVVVAVLGVAVTVATGGAAGPAVVAGVIGLLAGGAGISERVDARTADRKADLLERQYRSRWGY